VSKLSRHRRSSRARRAGVETLELILVTPIVVILLVAILQFGSVHIVQEAITNAATVGAREAAKGAPIEEVAVSVDAVLEPHGIDLVNKTITSGTANYDFPTDSGARIFIEYGPNSDQVEHRGDASVGTPPSSGTATPDLEAPDVRVTVLVSLDKAPIFSPATLNRFGFNFPGERYEVRAIARLE